AISKSDLTIAVLHTNARKTCDKWFVRHIAPHVCMETRQRVRMYTERAISRGYVTRDKREWLESTWTVYDLKQHK
ncbi:hypothetical protein ADUPG1_004922, partial [Aduncisulcus paluster]